MSTNTVSREARTDAQAKRVAKASKVTVTLAEVSQHISETAAKHGSAGSVLDTHAQVESLAGRTEAGLRAWYPIALEARAVGMKHRDFGEASGASKEALGRLSRGALILHAFESKGRNVPAIMVQSVANRTTESKMTALLADIKSGNTDLPSARAKALGPKADGESKGRKAGTPNTSTGGIKADSDWSIEPSQYVSALEIMRRHLGSLSTEEAGKTAKALRPVVTALMTAITSAERKAQTEAKSAEAKAKAAAVKPEPEKADRAAEYVAAARQTAKAKAEAKA